MNKARTLTEGAMNLAIFIVLLLITIYVPALGVLAAFTLSIPFIIYTVRHGLKNGIFMVIIAIPITLLLGTYVLLPFALMFGISGIVMGHLFSKTKLAYVVLLGGTVSFALTLLLQVVVASVFLNVDLQGVFQQSVNDSIQRSEEIMKSVGQAPVEEEIELIRENMRMMTYLIPTLLVGAGVILAFITQLFSVPVLKRLGHKPVSFPPLRDLRLPKSLLWYYLITLVCSLIPLDEGSFGYIAVINLLMVLQWLMFLQGVSFLFYYFHSKGRSKAIPVVITIIALVIPPAGTVLRIVGIVDLGFNLRKSNSQS
ncbi:YybS family protein [Bacillus sp. JZ8]